MITVDCQISRSAFSDERVFRITLTDGSEHVGAASANYFRKNDGSPLAEDEPPANRRVKGKVAARVVSSSGDIVCVSLPDGEVVNVSSNQLGQEVPADVFVQS
jgi:hypothetical protein